MHKDNLDQRMEVWERHCIFEETEENILKINDPKHILADSEVLKGNYLVLNSRDTDSFLNEVLKATVLIHPDNLEEAFTGVVLQHKGKKMLVTSMHCFDLNNPDYIPDGLKDNQHERMILEMGKEGFIQNPKTTNSLKLLIAYGPLDYVIFNYEGDAGGVELEDSQLEWPAKCVCLGFPRKYYSTRNEVQLPIMSVGVCSPFRYELTYVLNFEGRNPYRQLLYTGRTCGGFSGGPVISHNGKLMGIVIDSTPDEHRPI